MKHRENPFHRCERWWARSLQCPFVTEEREDQEDTEESELEFDNPSHHEAERPVKVPAPTKKKVTEEQAVAVPDAVVRVPVTLEAIATAGTEPAPVLVKRAPAIAKKRRKVSPKVGARVPARVPQKQAAQRATANVGSTATRATVANAVGIKVSYLQELEETGWGQTITKLAETTTAIQRAYDPDYAPENLGSGLHRSLVISVALAAAAEILYTQYVKGSPKSVTTPTKKFQTRNPRAGGDADPARKALEARRARMAKAGKNTVKAIQKGLAGTQGGIQQGGRGGGFHKMADQFRKPPALRKLTNREKANLQVRHIK